MSRDNEFKLEDFLEGVTAFLSGKSPITIAKELIEEKIKRDKILEKENERLREEKLVKEMAPHIIKANLAISRILAERYGFMRNIK